MTDNTLKCITAAQAKTITEENKNKKIECIIPDTLWYAIMRRIKNAAKEGINITSLSSISDCGNGVRGIEHYLDGNVTYVLCEKLSSLGYTIVVNDLDDPFVKITYGEVKLNRIKRYQYIVSW